jgi:hypothetical protein
VLETQPLRLKETFRQAQVQVETSRLDQAYLLYKTMNTVVEVAKVAGVLAKTKQVLEMLLLVHTAVQAEAVVLTGVAQVAVLLVMVQQVEAEAVVDTIVHLAVEMALAVEALVSLVQLELLKRSQYNEKIRIH